MKSVSGSIEGWLAGLLLFGAVVLMLTGCTTSTEGRRYEYAQSIAARDANLALACQQLLNNGRNEIPLRTAQVHGGNPSQHVVGITTDWCMRQGYGWGGQTYNQQGGALGPGYYYPSQGGSYWRR